MKFRHFLSLVPKRVKTAALILGVSTVSLGVIAGFYSGSAPNHSSLPFSGPGAGLGFGSLAGVLLAAWVTCLGYVYADARRRAMPPILWTLVAIFIPNLLGFLLYFAIRRPIAQTCVECGQVITADHRFCSWCGHHEPPPPPVQTTSGPKSTELNPTTPA
jgi:Phospholipase_D-nuclease N-terminal